ncbi:MAG: Xaa-Pro peptidase family protein [Bacillota bacterium]
MKKERWQRLIAEIETEGLAGLALVPGPNFFYMTGLHMKLSERPTLCAVTREGNVTFLMPKLEARKGELISASLSEAGVPLNFRVEPFSDEEGPSAAYARVFGASGMLGKWALEYRNMRLLEFSLIRNSLGQFAWTDAGEILKKMRMIKDGTELSSMEKACALTDLGVDIARRLLVPGKTGAEVAGEVERQLKQKGAQGVGMSLATGADTGLPHAGTSSKTIVEGDLAWLDLMVSVDGYWGDITRTYAIGAISDEMKRIYRVVLEAQETARTKTRPGMTGAEVDALARDVIASYGYGDYFIHRTGHGLGLEVHEDPYVVASNDVPLPIGSVVTIEPGIYIPGKGGVRIEDDVVITEKGARSLTQYPRNLLDDETKLVV